MSTQAHTPIPMAPGYFALPNGIAPSVGGSLVLMIVQGFLGASWPAIVLAGLFTALLPPVILLAVYLGRVRSKIAVYLPMMQKFNREDGNGYEGWVQLALKADPRAGITDPRVVIESIEFSHDNEYYSPEADEKIPLEWSREVEKPVIFDDWHEKRVNVVVFRQATNDFLVRAQTGMPTNLLSLKRKGVHRFNIAISAKRKGKPTIETGVLKIDNRDPSPDPEISLKWAGQ